MSFREKGRTRFGRLFHFPEFFVVRRLRVLACGGHLVASPVLRRSSVVRTTPPLRPGQGEVGLVLPLLNSRPRFCWQFVQHLSAQVTRRYMGHLYILAARQFRTGNSLVQQITDQNNPTCAETKKHLGAKRGNRGRPLDSAAISVSQSRASRAASRRTVPVVADSTIAPDQGQGGDGGAPPQPRP